MGDEFIDFTWSVCELGYKWVDALPLIYTEGKRDIKFHSRDVDLSTLDYEPAPLLKEKNGYDRAYSDRQMRSYRPLEEHTSLFRVFAQVEPSKEGILGFARQYGRLGDDVVVLAQEYPSDGTVIYGEPDFTWESEIREMKAAVELWDQHCDDDSGGSGPPEKPDKTELTRRALEDTRKNPSPRPTISPINESLIKIKDIVDDRLKGALSTPLVWVPEKRRMEMRLTPVSLRAAIWLQFALAVTGNRRYRQCELCGSWFEIRPEIARTTRLFCSGSCRVKAYRNRISEARDMYSEGTSIEEIASSLGTDTDVVKRWLENQQPDKGRRPSK